MFGLPPHTLPPMSQPQPQSQSSFPMPSTVFVEVEGLPYVRRIDLQSCLHSLDKTNSGGSMPITYNEFMQYVCKQWSIACSIGDLALLELDASSKPAKAVLVTSNAEWNQVWQRYRRKRAPPAFQMTGFAAHAPTPDVPVPAFKIVARPELPAAFLTQQASSQASPVGGVDAQPRTPPLPSQSTPTSPHVSSSEYDARAHTSSPSTDNTAVIGELKIAIRDLAKEVTESVGSSVTRTVRDVVQSALRDARLANDGDAPRGATSNAFSPATGGVAGAGAEAAQSLLSVVDRFVSNIGARHGVHVQGGPRPHNTHAPAPTQTQTTTASGTRTPSSSYDNMPPSEPLREETPSPEANHPPAATTASSAREVGLDNAAAVRNLSENAKGKERASPTHSGASSSEDWQLAGGSADEANAGQQAIEENNLALEDAFNAMLARIRQ